VRPRVTSQPADCATRRKVQPGDYLLVHYAISVDESSEDGAPGHVLETTRRVGVPVDVRFDRSEHALVEAWFVALQGVCEGARVEFLVPRDLGYVGAKENDQQNVTMLVDVELLRVSSAPLEPPNLFEVVDRNKNGVVEQEEFGAYFAARAGGSDPASLKTVPWALLAKSDTNDDGVISWDEFDGPKGSKPPASAAKALADIERNTESIAADREKRRAEMREGHKLAENIPFSVSKDGFAPLRAVRPKSPPEGGDAAPESGNEEL